MWPSRGPKESQKDPITIRAKHVPRMDAIAAPALQGRPTGSANQETLSCAVAVEWHWHNRYDKGQSMTIRACS